MLKLERITGNSIILDSPFIIAVSWASRFASFILVNRLVLKLRQQTAAAHVGGGRSGDGVASQIFFAPNPPEMRDSLFEDSEGDIEQVKDRCVGGPGVDELGIKKVAEVGEKDAFEIQGSSGTAIQEVTRSRTD